MLYAHFLRALSVIAWVSTAQLVLAADVLPYPEPPFKGKMGLSTKDSTPDWPKPVTAPKGAPNIVLIMLDDVGFGDTSTFGGVAQTPVLDKLAAEGLRYNRFHTTGICSPTRASLLTGRNHHRVGYGQFGGGGFPGYDGIWRKDTVSMADVLRRNGYSTSAFGKWHNTPHEEITAVGPFDRWPTGLGFEYFYGFMGGLASHWEPQLYRNTTAVDPSLLLKDKASKNKEYYLTNDLVDDAVGWLRTHESIAPDKPYFLYFATGAAHSPHHAPKDWVEKYRGKFDQGWDKLREEIFARQKKLGVIPADAELTPRARILPAWDSYSLEERRLFARQMEIYAAFIAYTDYQLGRLVKTVKEGPQGDNTLILYLVGDNGASAWADANDSRGLTGTTIEYKGKGNLLSVKEKLAHIDQLGGPLLFNDYAAGWSWAGNTPFQWMKHIPSHFGGTRNPLVISWPDHIKEKGGLRTQFTHVNDVASTLYEVAGIQFPSKVDGVKQEPLDGVSFAYSFDHPNAPSRHKVQYFTTTGNRAIYQDGWVAGARHLVPWKTHRQANDDFENDRWELYHVDKDFSQAHDLAEQYPQKLKALQTLFDAEARKNDVYPLDAWRMKPAASSTLKRTK